MFHQNVKHVEVRQKELRSASDYESSRYLISDKTLYFVFFNNTKVLLQRYQTKVVKINKHRIQKAAKSRVDIYFF